MGAVETEVLHLDVADIPPIHGGSGKTLFLGSSSRKHVVFVYDPMIGVTLILYDPAATTDFVSLARSGRITDWMHNLADDRLKANKAYPLTSFDAFGRCHTT